MKKTNISKKKEKLIDFLLNDISLTEQERILKSRKNEMDEDYLERLENRLWGTSYKKLLEITKKLGYMKK